MLIKLSLSSELVSYFWGWEYIYVDVQASLERHVYKSRRVTMSPKQISSLWRPIKRLKKSLRCLIQVCQGWWDFMELTVPTFRTHEGIFAWYLWLTYVKLHCRCTFSRCYSSVKDRFISKIRYLRHSSTH